MMHDSGKNNELSRRPRGFVYRSPVRAFRTPGPPFARHPRNSSKNGSTDDPLCASFAAGRALARRRLLLSLLLLRVYCPRRTRCLPPRPTCRTCAMCHSSDLHVRRCTLRCTSALSSRTRTSMREWTLLRTTSTCRQSARYPSPSPLSVYPSRHLTLSAVPSNYHVRRCVLRRRETAVLVVSSRNGGTACPAAVPLGMGTARPRLCSLVMS